MPASMRSSVVLPEPDGPTTVKNSPSRTSRSTRSTAASSPNVRLTPTSCRIGCAAAAEAKAVSRAPAWPPSSGRAPCRNRARCRTRPTALISSSRLSHWIASSSSSVKRSKHLGLPIWATGLNVPSAKATMCAVSGCCTYSRNSHGQRRQVRVVDRRGDLDPGDAALAAHRPLVGRDAAQLWVAVGAGRRDRVGAAGQVQVDLARDQRLVHRGDVADQLGAAEHPLGGLGELGQLGLVVLA